MTQIKEKAIEEVSISKEYYVYAQDGTLHSATSFKVGDKVSVIWVRSYRPGYTVVKVDEAYGRVYVKADGKDRVECKSIVEVTKVLDN